MNQTIRIIIATILIALNFTHSASADAQQKFSFQGVSYNGAIKPEATLIVLISRLSFNTYQHHINPQTKMRLLL